MAGLEFAWPLCLPRWHFSVMGKVTRMPGWISGLQKLLNTGQENILNAEGDDATMIGWTQLDPHLNDLSLPSL